MEALPLHRTVAASSWLEGRAGAAEPDAGRRKGKAVGSAEVKREERSFAESGPEAEGVGSLGRGEECAVAVWRLNSDQSREEGNDCLEPEGSPCDVGVNLTLVFLRPP